MDGMAPGMAPGMACACRLVLICFIHTLVHQLRSNRRPFPIISLPFSIISLSIFVLSPLPSVFNIIFPCRWQRRRQTTVRRRTLRPPPPHRPPPPPLLDLHHRDRHLQGRRPAAVARRAATAPATPIRTRDSRGDRSRRGNRGVAFLFPGFSTRSVCWA